MLESAVLRYVNKQSHMCTAQESWNCTKHLTKLTTLCSISICVIFFFYLHIITMSNLVQIICTFNCSRQRKIKWLTNGHKKNKCTTITTTNGQFILRCTRHWDPVCRISGYFRYPVPAAICQIMNWIIYLFITKSCSHHLGKLQFVNSEFQEKRINEHRKSSSIW